MEREIMIDGKMIKFKASARATTRYRDYFRQDLIDTFNELELTDEDTEETIVKKALKSSEVFEQLGFIMAGIADPKNTPSKYEDWLDSFSPTGLGTAIPEIMMLWTDSMMTTSEAKKK